jgi:hypothetical protein
VTGDTHYEVHARAKKKSGRAPLELRAAFRASHWQFALKAATKLRGQSAEVVVRKVVVTDEVRYRG